MTAALHDEVVTAAPARKLTLVREAAPIAATRQVSAPKKVTRRVDGQPFGYFGDPLVDGAAHLLSIPLRHVYAVLWRVGVLEVRA